MWNDMLLYLKKNVFTEYEHGYVYIIGMLYVDVIYYARPVRSNNKNTYWLLYYDWA